MSALRCVAGDIAVILRGEGAGTFVDVLRRAPDQPGTGAPSWEVRLKAPLRCTLVAHHSTRPPRYLRELTLQPGETACVADDNLQPIRPPAAPKATPAPAIELETV
jgi:hypothetical protein